MTSHMGEEAAYYKYLGNQWWALANTCQRKNDTKLKIIMIIKNGSQC